MVDMMSTRAGAKCPCCRQKLDVSPRPGLVPAFALRRVLPASLALLPPAVYAPQLRKRESQAWFAGHFESNAEPPPQSISPDDLVLGSGNRNVFEFAKLLDALPFPNRLRLSVRELFVEFRLWLHSLPNLRGRRDRSALSMREFETQLEDLGFSARPTRGIGLSLNRRVKGYNLFIKGSVEFA